MKTQKRVRVRIAPSPTGLLHIGTARSALFNWLFARNMQGAFIVRIEDTDEARSAPEFELMLIEGLHWLGLKWDEGVDVVGGAVISKGPYAPYRQSERGAIYKQYLHQLIAEHKAYICYCTKEELEAEKQGLEAQGFPPKYSGHCHALASPPAGKSPQTIRFRTPSTIIKFKDAIRGNVEFNSELFGDFIIARNMDSVLHHLAVTVDDALMEITHVIRGEDLLSNTPRQILLQHALGFPEPIYAHMPLILNADRSKLSKRKNKVSLLVYRDEGYLPEAMMNFLALLGWHSSGDQEIFSREALIEAFDLQRVQKSGAVFNQEKLEWMNGEYLKALPLEELVERVKPFLMKSGIHAESKLLARVVGVLRERARTLAEFVLFGAFFFATPSYEKSLLVWKNDSEERTKDVLQKAMEIIDKVPGDELHPETFMIALESLTAVYGKGTVLWPLRVAFSGQATSPDPSSIAAVLGKEECLRRLTTAFQKIS